jgi:hypothetical protein
VDEKKQSETGYVYQKQRKVSSFEEEALIIKKLTLRIKSRHDLMMDKRIKLWRKECA